MPCASFEKLSWFLLLVCCFSRLYAQSADAQVPRIEVIARLVDAPHGTAQKTAKPLPAVIWLSPLRAGAAPNVTPGSFTLLQKNRMFAPHLLVVPVGSSVAFPNTDPFYHNVFSLFDGRRFDLGLYEAGSTRSVVFSREGVSYIFCNIHSEMSAVVIALATPYFGRADPEGVFRLKNVPLGEYDLHVWIEGLSQSSLDRLTRRVHCIGGGETFDLGEIGAGRPEKQQHLDKFGQPYDSNSHPIY